VRARSIHARFCGSRHATALRRRTTGPGHRGAVGGALLALRCSWSGHAVTTIAVGASRPQKHAATGSELPMAAGPSSAL
jgi:hypothetical protein